MSCAFLYGDLKIPGHAHGKHIHSDIINVFRSYVNTKFPHLPKIRPVGFGVFGIGCNGHQPPYTNIRKM